MTDHTPEPWPPRDPRWGPEARLSWDDYDRARACVNACAGIPTEHLERGSVAKLFTAADAISKYYVQSLNVGPGKYPKRESLLWRPLHAALAPFRKD